MTLLFFFRMATVQHLARLLDVKPETVIYMIHTINKNERGRAVESYKLRGTHSPKVYTLGPRGCQIVGKTLGIKVEYYPFSKRQGRHYCGINDILYRIVKALGIDNVIQRVKWWNTRGAKQVVLTNGLKPWPSLDDRGMKNKQKKEYKSMLSPDAWLQIDGRSYWIEYDNDIQNNRPVCRILTSSYQK